MYDQSELANRYFWILEYITVDHLDPVSTVQKQLRKGSYRKKHGSRYDSHNEDLGLFAMLSPQGSDPEPAVFYSPPTAARGDAFSPAEASVDGDSWRSNPSRARFSPSKLSRRWSFRGSSHGGKHSSRGLQRSQSLQAPANSAIASSASLAASAASAASTVSTANASNTVSSASAATPANPSTVSTVSTVSPVGRAPTSPASPQALDRRVALGRRGSRRSRERSLERWASEATEERSLEEGIRSLGAEGTAWDQFQVNRERFGVESGFNEALYTMPMSSLEVDEGEWREVVRIAEEMGEGDGGAAGGA